MFARSRESCLDMKPFLFLGMIPLKNVIENALKTLGKP